MKRLILALLAVAALALPAIASAQVAGVDTAYQGAILLSPNAPPSNGVNGVETLTFGGTITGGTFALQFLGNTTGPITWSATNATLIANISTALNAINTVGTGGFTVAAGSLTAGIGTVTATAGANIGLITIPVFTIVNNALTGTSPTLTVALTTTGTQADGRKSAKGTLCIGSDGKLYQNLGAPLAPTWTKVSAE